MKDGKMNRREFLLLTAGLGGMAVFAACAPKAAPAEPTKAPAGDTGSTEPTQAAEAPSAESVHLQIMWRTNEDENPMVDELIENFQEKNSDITVEQIMVPWEEFEPKLMSMYAGGIAPDIYGTGGTNPYVERYYRDMVLVLDPFLEKEDAGFTDGLWSVGLDSYRKEGDLVAMTFCLCNAGVFLNATLFDEAGLEYPPVDWSDDSWTWETMIDTAKQLTIDKNGDGKVDQYGISCGHYTPWYYTRLWGEDLVSEDDYASGILHKWQTDDSAIYDALVGGLSARSDAIHVHKVNPNPATSESLGQMGPMLKTGVLAMEFTGGWALWGDLPEQYKFRAAANPIGGVNGSGTRCDNTWAEPLQICSKTKNPEQSWEFVKYVTVDMDALSIEMDHRSTVPALKSALDTYLEVYGKRFAMSADEMRTYFTGALEHAKTTVPCHILVGNAAIRDIQSAELDSVWLGERTAKEAIDIMIPKVNQALEDNIKQLNLT